MVALALPSRRTAFNCCNEIRTLLINADPFARIRLSLALCVSRGYPKLNRNTSVSKGVRSKGLDRFDL